MRIFYSKTWLARLAFTFGLFSGLGHPAQALGTTHSNVLAQLEKSLIQPSTPERGVERSRLFWFLGSEAQSEGERKTFFAKGLDASAGALKQEPDNPGAMLWWSANIGSIAAIDKNLSALRTITAVRDVLMKLKKVNPTYDHAAADRALGTLYLEAPSFISIGSNSLARSHLEAALKAFPEYPGNRITYARCLFEDGKKTEARRIALEVLLAKDFDRYPLESPQWIKTAQQIVIETKEGGTS